MISQKVARYWAIGLGATFVLALTIWFALDFQQNKREQIAANEYAQETLWPELKERIESSIEQFDREATSRLLQLQDIAQLETARKELYALRGEYLGVYFEQSYEIEEQLEKRIDGSMAEILWEESLKAETQAREIALNHPDTSAEINTCVAHAVRAYEAQKRINDEFSLSSRVNYPRESDLHGWINFMQATPLHNELIEVSGLAADSFQSSAWQQAIEYYEKAIALQESINNEFPEAPQADFTQIVRYEDKINDARSNILYETSLARETQGKHYLDANKPNLAIDELEEALEIQNRINLEFPGSDLVSAERSKTIATRIQSLNASDKMSQIFKMDEELDLILSVRLTDKLNYKLKDILDAFKTLEDHFPLAENPPIHLREKASYLLEKQAELEEILTLFDATLENGSGYSNLVDQRLYELVAGENPSRVKSAQNPVESINLYDIEQFLKKIAWITSKPAYLPSWQELQTLQGVSEQPFSEWTSTGNDSGLTAVYDSKIEGQPSPGAFKDPLYRSRAVSFRFKLETK